MASKYPQDKDTLKKVSPRDSMSTKGHAGMHNDVADAVMALEDKVGVTDSTDADSLEYRVTYLEDNGGGGGPGSQGPQGAQGAQGTAGAAGSQGPQGTQGDAGAAGSQGPQGTAGSQGPQGTPGTPVYFTYGWESEPGAPAGRLSRRFYTEQAGTIAFTRLESENGDGTGTASVELRLNGAAIDTVTLNASTYIGSESIPNTLSFVKGDYFTVYTNHGGGVSGRLILLVVCQ